MTYIVAVIEDATFEDPHVVIGTNEEEVAIAVAVYLRAAKPMTPLGRLELSDPPPDKAWLDHLWPILDDIDDVDVTVYSTGSTMLPVHSFLAWTEANREALERQHRPPAVDVLRTL